MVEILKSIAETFKIFSLMQFLFEYQKKFLTKEIDSEKSLEILKLQEIERILLDLNETNADTIIKRCEKFKDNHEIIISALISCCIISVKNQNNMVLSFIEKYNAIYSGTLELLVRMLRNMFNEQDESFESKVFNQYIDSFTYLLLVKNIMTKKDLPKYDYYMSSKFRITQDYVNMTSGETRLEDNSDHIEKCLKGVSPSDMNVAIRNDDVELLQQLLSSAESIDMEFEGNDYENYERNHVLASTVIEYSALYGSIKCFKYCINNHAILSKKLGFCAIAGGNIEIIRICKQQKCNLNDCINISVIFHYHELTRWIIENLPVKQHISIKNSIKAFNFNIIDDIIHKSENQCILEYSIQYNNIFLLKWVLNQIKVGNLNEKELKVRSYNLFQQ
ncbi:hypothetical protein TRFO_24803 [Tritrichomonas foetus]|uniref:DUF3447 domain-containing protein n=1 Tax=Tritrichomonas foetus TaxID=1144522 RepID=A0A1J4K736_9EUKA|nr:hypothetical protein TRFO_24803 [Tritrichomonas foetus]|eukprot:OHT07003.1 hypothetical protein TRFO_24803 [Tritrichomonas foetus]